MIKHSKRPWDNSQLPKATDLLTNVNSTSTPPHPTDLSALLRSLWGWTTFDSQILSVPHHRGSTSSSSLVEDNFYSSDSSESSPLPTPNVFTVPNTPATDNFYANMRTEDQHIYSNCGGNKFAKDSRRRPLVLNDSPTCVNMGFDSGYPLEPITHISSARNAKTVRAGENSCLPHCACRSDSSASDTSLKPTGFKRLFNGKVNVEEAKVQNAWSDGNLDTFCSVCTCFLDPVELNDLSAGYSLPGRDDLRVKSFKKQPNSLDCGYHGFHSQSAAARQGRNKLNLTIDTAKTQEKNACLTDPMYNMIMNSPIVRKLREFGFTYPGENEKRRKKLLTGVLVLLVLTVLIIILTNTLVAKFLLSNNSVNDTKIFSFKPSTAKYIFNYIPTSKLTEIPTLVPPELILTKEISFGNQISTERTTAETVTTAQPTPKFIGLITASTEQTTLTQSSTTTTTTAISIQTTTENFTRSKVSTKPTPPTWIPRYPEDSQCKGDQLQIKCLSGTSRLPCLFAWERCDGVQDCSDGSDESDCAIIKCYGNFQCANNQCVSLAKVCNGVSDCTDGSDEQNCETFKCQPYEYRCPSGYCIPHEWLCDGESDCPDHRDEFNCSKECKSNEFMCPEGWCIPQNWKCNGVVDCSNGEDEHNCDCPVDQLKCSSGNCISPNQLCNGIVDCTDGSDEWNCVAQNKIDNLLVLKAADDGKLVEMPVCSDDWSSELSDKTCKQLGFSKAVNYDFLPLTGNDIRTFKLTRKGLALLSSPANQLQIAGSPTSSQQCISRTKVKLNCDSFTCGRWQSAKMANSRVKRVVGGELSGEHQWPSVGTLYYPPKKWTCTATILSPYWAITSALCVQRTDKSPADWKFIAGSAHPTEDNPNGMEIRLVDKFVPHPSYKFRTILADYDVMLIRLNKPLELNLNSVQFGLGQPKLAAICLPDPIVAEPVSLCITAGWGYTTPGGFDINRQLRHVEMGITPQLNCNSSDHYRGAISSRMLCAGSNQNDVGPCFNDEGAPLMCLSAKLNRWYLAGVLTSHNCGAARHPAVYADVKSLQNWIRNTIGL